MRYQHGLLVALLILMSACAETLDPSTGPNPDLGYFSQSVGVIQNEPADFATNVPVDQTIKFRYTVPATQLAGVDNVSVRVERQDTREILEGRVEIQGDTIEWIPTHNGYRVALDTNSSYLAFAQFLTTSQGDLVFPKIIPFETGGPAQSTGRFKIVTRYGGPVLHSSLQGVATPIEFLFSEPVWPGQEGCRPEWESIVQVSYVGSIQEQGNFVSGAVSGQVCLVCSVTGRCDLLQFRPTRAWSWPSVLHIRVQSSSFLRGVSGEPLGQPWNEWPSIFY